MKESNGDSSVRLDTRLSGQIRRYHTWPTVSNQTIADHCWNLLRIYFSVVEKVDQHMVYHIVFHDIGETEIGDAPYPVKHDNPQLKEVMDGIEMKSRLRQMHFWDSFKQVMLTDEDMLLFKQIELIEMAEFGLDEVLFGNSHGLIVADRCLRAVYEQKPCPRLVEYVKKRLGLFFKQDQLRLKSDMISTDWWSPDEWEAKHAG